MIRSEMMHDIVSYRKDTKRESQMRENVHIETMGDRVNIVGSPMLEFRIKRYDLG